MPLLNGAPVVDEVIAAIEPLARTECDRLADFSVPTSRVRYRALAWITLAGALAYLCRNATGVAESAIRDELRLTLSESGWFMGAFFWTYAIFQIPSAWFSERLGSRIALSVFTIASSAAMLGMAIAPNFWLLIVAQLVMGVAQAGLLPATCNSIGRWMPLAQVSFGCGALGAGMQVGAIAAAGLTGAMLAPIGWRLAFVAFAVPGIVWTVGFFFRFRDDPSEVLPPDSDELALIRSGRKESARGDRQEVGELQELLAIVRKPAMWWLCGQQICRSAGAVFFASWFPTFLQKTRGVSVEASGYMQGVVFGGSLLGCVCGGLFTDWVWRRTQSLRASRSGVGAASLATCSAVILAAWFVESAEAAVMLLSIGAFVGAFGGACAFAAAIDVGGTRVPQVAAVMNMSGNFAAAVCPVIVGNLFQSTKNWNLVLLLFAAVYLAGAVCWFLVNPLNKEVAEN
jgi:ACS family D-galactonate transporter-like MFS transporter